MHRITKEIEFCYGHRLLNYDGKCRYLHGHNGRLEITFAAPELDHRGMVFDFSEIKALVKTWVDEHLDHQMILHRDDPALPFLREAGEPHYVLDENPTAENIAKLIFTHVREGGYPVEKVRLWETATSWAEYGEA